MKDPWNPTEEEIKEWAFSEAPWPDQDWDIAVNNKKNDQLLVALANDVTCPNNEFFVHAIYFMIGDFIYSEGSNRRRSELMELLLSLDHDATEPVKEWRQQSLELLSGNREFEYEYWCQHMFQ